MKVEVVAIAVVEVVVVVKLPQSVVVVVSSNQGEVEGEGVEHLQQCHTRTSILVVMVRAGQLALVPMVWLLLLLVEGLW